MIIFIGIPIWTLSSTETVNKNSLDDSTRGNNYTAVHLIAFHRTFAGLFNQTKLWKWCWIHIHMHVAIISLLQPFESNIFCRYVDWQLVVLLRPHAFVSWNNCVEQVQRESMPTRKKIFQIKRNNTFKRLVYVLAAIY